MFQLLTLCRVRTLLQVVTFECDNRAEPILEVSSEDACEYTFVVHTNVSCPQSTPIGVECRAEGFHDLVAFQRMSARTVMVPGRGRVYLAVCDTVGEGLQGCEPSSAACLLETSG